ncbi:hypothetical protein M673_12645 [Aureimonas sp. AU20]|nr:hypothetical protein M673_12645 [Aureimonas sp. AU20]
MDRRGHVIEALEAKIAALATPLPQPADAVREGAEAADLFVKLFLSFVGRDRGTDRFEKTMDDLTAEAAKVVDKIEAVRAALTEPAPATIGNPATEEEWQDRNGLSSDETSEPAPAGEAVEPVAWTYEYLCEGYWTSALEGYRPKAAPSIRNIRPLYAHPAPEDTARLREDLERANAKANGFTKAYGMRLARFVTQAEELEVTKRDRDDARKALEAAQTKVAVLDGLLTAKDVWFDFGSGFRAHFSFEPFTDSPWRADLHGLHAAARSASREATR